MELPWKLYAKKPSASPICSRIFWRLESPLSKPPLAGLISLPFGLAAKAWSVSFRDVERGLRTFGESKEFRGLVQIIDEFV